MANRILPGPVLGRPSRLSEFAGKETGDCGPDSLLVAESALRWRVPTGSDLDAMVTRMHANGWASANGVTWNIDEVPSTALQAYADGFQFFLPGPGENFLEMARRWAGIHPIIMNTNNGQALVDSISNMGENADHLLRHVICLVGRHTTDSQYSFDGFWAADGDNYAQGDVLQLYSEQVILDSQPSGYRIWTMQLVPDGWADDGTTLKGPNSLPVVLGFRNWVLSHAWEPDNWPLNPEYHTKTVEPGNPGVGAGSRQDFRYRSLGWTAGAGPAGPEGGVYRIWTGQDILALSKQLAQVSVVPPNLAQIQTAIHKIQTDADLAQAAFAPIFAADIQQALQLAGAPPPVGG